MIGRFVGEEYNAVSTSPRVKITMADRDRELEMATWGINRTLEGIDGVRTALHVYRGHRNRMHVSGGGLEDVLPHLGRVQVHILALEMAAPDTGSMDVLRAFPEDKLLGLGVIDVLKPEIDSPGLLVQRAEEALRYVDRERLILNPDCGFAPAPNNTVSIDEAYLKLVSLARAAEAFKR